MSISLDEATCLFSLGCALRTCLALDQTIDDLPCAQNVCRSDQRQSRTASGKCAVATPTDYLASTDQTTGLPENRSSAPGFLASMVQAWKQALFIVQPETDLARAA